MAGFAMIFVWMFVIETQGKSLESIQAQFEARASGSACACSRPISDGTGGLDSAHRNNEQYRRPSREGETRGLINEGSGSTTAVSSAIAVVASPTNYATSI
jgi:hypothetical protein